MLAGTMSTAVMNARLAKQATKGNLASFSRQLHIQLLTTAPRPGTSNIRLVHALQQSLQVAVATVINQYTYMLVDNQPLKLS
jgi:hypothetical protein